METRLPHELPRAGRSLIAWRVILAQSEAMGESIGGRTGRHLAYAQWPVHRRSITQRGSRTLHTAGGNGVRISREARLGCFSRLGRDVLSDAVKPWNLQDGLCESRQRVDV